MKHLTCFGIMNIGLRKANLCSSYRGGGIWSFDQGSALDLLGLDVPQIPKHFYDPPLTQWLDPPLTKLILCPGTKDF